MERIDELGINNKKIIQDTNYFCFGLDSVLLANFVKSTNPKNLIVELCAGGGVISVLMSQKIKCDKIYSVELQDEMFNLLDKNVKLNQLEDKIYIIHKDIKELELKDKVDIVVCNPPYKSIGTGTINENTVKYIARHEKMCTLKDVFLCSTRILKQKGSLYIVHKPERLCDLIALARKYNLEAKNIRFVYPKINAKATLVLVEYKYYGGVESHVLPPLIEYDEFGKYTKEINDIYWGENKIE